MLRGLRSREPVFVSIMSYITINKEKDNLTRRGGNGVVVRVFGVWGSIRKPQTARHAGDVSPLSSMASLHGYSYYKYHVITT